MPSFSDRRLDSWKEIAEFCDRDVRTVLRWEKHRGLPVYRIPGGGRVFAYTFEVERWLCGGWTRNVELNFVVGQRALAPGGITQIRRTDGAPLA